jgi:hypothetical protein
VRVGWWIRRRRRCRTSDAQPLVVGVAEPNYSDGMKGQIARALHDQVLGQRPSRPLVENLSSVRP